MTNKDTDTAENIQQQSAVDQQLKMMSQLYVLGFFRPILNVGMTQTTVADNAESVELK